MADVLIVCVREDEPRAKALAEMFEAAGFSIGGAPGSDGALRSSGAGLVVWSQASIRSRPFLDAAQRVINAEKAVVASLIEPPPPSSIGDSPVFDLSRWDGDPNDPSLDPLFFAVDRMVNSARAGVGAATQAEPRGYQAPPAYDPPPRASRPPPPAPQANFARGPASGDPLGGEAEHWRAIRDSRNPSDFMDYLARYGAEGAFAEVAELRLKQLTQSPSSSESRSTPPRSAPLPAASRPTLPPRLESTRRLDAPPMRRADPPPLRRPPPPERTFDRAELREPPRSEGSPIRAFILIALLGGAALAGGLYFGGGIPDLASAPETEQTAEVAPSTTFDDPSTVLDEPVGVPLEDSAAPAPAPDRRAEARREEARREEARREPVRREEPEAPPPAPTTSWASNNAAGGPTSLSPGSSGPAANATPPTPVPLVPAATPAAAPTDRGTTRPTGSVVWASRPTARRVADLYPERASREGAGGRVELDCSVRSNQSLACSVANESPAGLGFGRAALNAAGSYRAQPWLSDGTDSTGARTRVVFQFNAPEQ